MIPRPARPPLEVPLALRRAASLWACSLPRTLPLWAALALPAAALEAFGARAHLSALGRAQLDAPLELTLGVALSLAAARIYLARALGHPTGLWRALAFALRRWTAAAAVSVVAGLLIGLGLILLVAPGIAVALDLSVAAPLLAATSLDANQVLRRSRAITFGARGRLALALAAAAAPALAARALLALAPEPGSLALGFLAELACAALDGLFAAGQVACFARLIEDPARAALAGCDGPGLRVERHPGTAPR